MPFTKIPITLIIHKRFLRIKATKTKNIIKMGKYINKYLLITILLAGCLNNANSQTIILDTLKMGTLQAQIKTLEYRTRTYDDYRAIREDYFQLFTNNAIDSLNLVKDINNSLKNSVAKLDKSVDSLKTVVDTTNSQLMEATNMRDSVKFFGANINKNLYNTILWTIIIVLLVLLVSGFMAYNKCYSITKETKKDHKNLMDEFEEYKQKTRIERERTNVEHFRELQKLKGINK